MQRSTSNNLLQLADYVAGTINRSIIDERNESKIFSKMMIIASINRTNVKKNLANTRESELKRQNYYRTL